MNLFRANEAAKKTSNLSVCILLSLVCIQAPGLANYENTEESPKKYKPVQSNDVINRTHGGYSESQIAYVKIKRAFYEKDYDKAIKLGRELIDLTPMNLDAKVVYAEALYQKYKENPKDKSTKNKCIRMWLIIHRLIKNDGWTLSDRSRHTTFRHRFHGKERRDLVTRQRLIELCGRVPKWRETDRKFLKKHLEPERNVAGQIVDSSQQAYTIP